jgi:transcriptional regulator with XRE-family HTH domain
MTETAELGEFLKARRAALDPADLGLPTGFNQRRVAGLRREELAQLAGISVDYYTRLEQGRARNVSDSVLGSLSRALRLHTDEETYLRNLAAPKRKRAARPRAQRARELHPEWETVAKEVVANLRSESGKYPDDPHLARLVGELSLGSEEFRKLWAKHAVREKAHSWKAILNPVVGELRLRYETLRLPDDPDQALVIYTAEPGSESERALGLLASWVVSRPGAELR